MKLHIAKTAGKQEGSICTSYRRNILKIPAYRTEIAKMKLQLGMVTMMGNNRRRVYLRVVECKIVNLQFLHDRNLWPMMNLHK